MLMKGDVASNRRLGPELERHSRSSVRKIGPNLAVEISSVSGNRSGKIHVGIHVEHLINHANSLSRAKRRLRPPVALGLGRYKHVPPLKDRTRGPTASILPNS
ncbi:Hypothetical protein NTJ_10775 [Nesidiocoris tenuis]|uniref:Uncharacterized protein n=1 Tax=Nesidiocoris tenuis TaxID=355587 RepID=A0ABN7B0M7_9HEMI|nr:Hypothetical protein NTJ_10775 [Nesidiocoris tenuis]